MKNNNSDSKADGVNLAKIIGDAQGLLGGGQSEPIRKRGYYRALKRKAPWALLKQSIKGILRDMNASFFKEMLEPNKLLGLSAWLPEGEQDRIVPIIYTGYPPVGEKK